MLREAIRLARLNIDERVLYIASLVSAVATFSILYTTTKSLCVSLISSALVAVFVILYPFFVLRGRRASIELILPHAIAYMQSLCGVMNLYEIFRQIFNEKEIYKELSEEFGLVVRDVEMLGYSLVDAMRNLANNTPSKSLREFLEGLIMAFESGSDLKGYIAKRIELIRERAKRQMEMNMRTLEIVSEVFVVLFVALPIFLAIALTTMKILGTNLFGIVRMYMYVFIPICGVAVLYLVDLMNVKEDLGVVRAPRGIVKAGMEKKPSILDMIRTNYYYSFIFSLPAILIVLFIVKNISFKYPESSLILLIISAFLSISIAFEYRAKFVRRIDKEIPEFLRKILNLKEVGLTLGSIIRMIRESEIGVISRELRRVEMFVELGSTLEEALVEFVNRVGVSSIRRAISILVKASEATENLRDVLLTAIDDFEYGLKMRDLRFATGFSYATIVYLSFYIFLYTAYTLSHTFMSKLGVGGSSFVEPMYRTSIMVSIFSGLLAGEMEGGHILYGLKHVFLFLLSSLVVFEFLVG